MLNWFYDQSLEGGIELKATCAPHYFRVVRQRERRSAKKPHRLPAAIRVRHTCAGDRADGHGDAGRRESSSSCGRTVLLPDIRRTPERTSERMNAMTKGCLAGTGVCFLSHEGEVFPCGYLPVIAGDLSKQKFGDIWGNARCSRVAGHDT